MTYPLFITCPKGMEYLLQDEMTQLGLAVTKTTMNGVYGEASIEVLYGICLWSRLANRVLLQLHKGGARDRDSLYNTVRAFDWSELFNRNQSLFVDFNGHSKNIRHSMFGAQCVKDAIVDQCRDKGLSRPNIDKQDPSVRLHVNLKHDQITLSLDLVGYSLHQRGYRQQAGIAPLKENVAAALLIRAGWPKQEALIDPCCGSGTILIEAAMMKYDLAPGLIRNDQKLYYWPAHDASLWQQLRKQARERFEHAKANIEYDIRGYDNSHGAIRNASQNALKAELGDHIRIEKRGLENFQIPKTLGAQKGLLISNPPYGERMDEINALIPLYQDLGQGLHQHCQGWDAAILTQHTILGKAIGLKAHKRYAFYNGALACQLLCFQLDDSNKLKKAEGTDFSPAASMLFNRLKKNQKHLSKWLKREGITCYRLYDCDLPEYACAVDVYQDWAHVQEYAPPKTIDETRAEQRVLDMMQVLPHVLGIGHDKIVLKQRKSQKGKSQYQKQGGSTERIMVREGKANLLLNLHDYLDCGLFLDHRPMRLRLHSEARDKRVLNLFCYTATASVHAALGGATATTNVDLSKTYLDWAKDNFKENALSPWGHKFIQADCKQWLAKCNETFDIIFMDPPSFSNSKRMDSVLDIQRDHAELIDRAMACLAPGGVLYFSTNLKKFKLDSGFEEKYLLKDISQQSIPEDFKRRRNVHHCYRITLL